MESPASIKVRLAKATPPAGLPSQLDYLMNRVSFPPEEKSAMSSVGQDTLRTRRTLEVDGRSYDYFSLEAAEAPARANRSSVRSISERPAT